MSYRGYVSVTSVPYQSQITRHVTPVGALPKTTCVQKVSFFTALNVHCQKFSGHKVGKFGRNVYMHWD
jgi:hypothetical protein